MSNIGKYALEIQEQANDLGYSTIQEAIDDGYAVVDDALIKVDSHDALAEMEKAHKEWLKEKEELLGDLNQLMMGMMASGKTLENSTDLSIVRRAWHFIDEGER